MYVYQTDHHRPWHDLNTYKVEATQQTSAFYVPAHGTLLIPEREVWLFVDPPCLNTNWPMLGPCTCGAAPHLCPAAVHKAVIWFWSIGFYDECQTRAILRHKR